ncbi:Rh157.4 [macacine betaherpesvirus 3]|nr:Rh157.4 [macacine betaherpesvirus 3]
MNRYKQLHLYVLLTILHHGLSDFANKNISLNGFCPMYPSPRQKFDMFTSYETYHTGEECDNSTLYVFKNIYGQYLIEKPSSWSDRLVKYLSGQKSTVFGKFAQMAATPTKVLNITEQEKRDYANHMIYTRIATIRFIVKDGIDVAHCQMRVTTWAKAESTFISFKVKIEVSNAYKRPSSICTRPNLVVPKVELLKPTAIPKTTKRTTRSTSAKPIPPPASPAKQVTTKTPATKPTTRKPTTTKPTSAKPAAAKPAAVKPPTTKPSSVGRALPAKPAPQKTTQTKAAKPKAAKPKKATKSPSKPPQLAKHFQYTRRTSYPLGRFYSSNYIRRKFFS